LASSFLQDVQDTVRRWGMSTSALELDINESLSVESSKSRSNKIERLSNVGVGIAIDEFRSDDSSIGHLWTNKVRRLKIAPWLIEAMIDDQSDADVA
jgi:EAL domain-containing protein (putative c-di-GMP-specific phosphodiesterase class I)